MTETGHEDDGLRADVKTISTPTQNTNTDPALAPYIDRVLAMDFVSDVPGPVSLNSDSKFSAPSVEALPPQARADVLKKLQGMSPEERAQKEPELVFEAVRNSVGKTRALTGVGSNALPYHKEAAEIAGQVHQLNREYDQLTTQLDRMTFETRFMKKRERTNQLKFRS